MYSKKYKLQKSVELGGVKYDIRSDYTVILSIIEAINDFELNGKEKSYVLLDMFYPDFEEIPEIYYQEAIDKCLEFISGENLNTKKKKEPKLVSWEQDFDLIASAVNKVVGYEIRDTDYDYEKNTGGLHWKTFLGAYQSVGDCTFAQVVRIRDKKARGKQLDKQDREWYKRNRDLVDFKHEYSTAEKDLFKEWGGG